MSQDEMLDCHVIGAGAAGLAAPVYLGRYRRKVLMVDDGASRLLMIPKTRNLIGFPDGIAGPELLELHASRYGVMPEAGRVEELLPMPDWPFEALVGSFARTQGAFGDWRTGCRT
jgi:thioredoxin reductase (NADPH)